jgi:hypothetical protein
MKVEVYNWPKLIANLLISKYLTNKIKKKYKLKNKLLISITCHYKINYK